MDLIVEDLGIIDYEKAWKLQDKYAAEIAVGARPPTLLFLEHPHVYTFGRKGRAENLLWNETELNGKNVAVHWVDRGGDVTYHGPGQLVGYPLLPLGKINSESKIPQADYVSYLRKLEKILIVALARLNLAAGQRPGKTGVWVQADEWSRCARCRPEDRNKSAKIAAIGVKVDARGITRHGFALNVNPDMSYWEGVVPCGLADELIASLADLLEPTPEMGRIKKEIVIAFGREFHFDPALRKRFHGEWTEQISE